MCSEKPSAASLENLEEEMVKLSACIDAAQHRLLTLIREFDEREGYVTCGMRSTAHWLGWRCGISAVAAREKVRVAKALPGLPLIDEDMSKGALSYSKVRALTRVATSENEQALVVMAKCATASQLEKICRKLKSVTSDLRASEETPNKTRWVSSETDDEGMTRLTARLYPDEAAIVMKAIDIAIEDFHSTRHCCDDSHQDVPAEASALSENEIKTLPKSGRADALVHIAHSFLSGQSGQATSGDRYQVLLHLEPDVLSGDYGLKLEDGTRLSSETLHRIACDSSLLPAVIDDKGQVLDIGRKTRVVPPSIRRALLLRDECCQFPGCDQTKWLSAHHVENWLLGGETKIGNLLLLCNRHHQCVHEEGFLCELSEDGHPIFYNPAGNVIPRYHSASEVREDPAALFMNSLAEKGVTLDAETNLYEYDPRPSYSACVAAAM